MSIPVATDPVLAVARKILALQERLVRIEKEKAAIQDETAAIQDEIGSAMHELARLAGEAVRPAAPEPPPPPLPPRYPSADPDTLAGMLLGHLARQPTRTFSGEELARELEIRGERAGDNLRAMLSRLVRRGSITRVRHGKYTAKALD